MQDPTSASRDRHDPDRLDAFEPRPHLVESRQRADRDRDHRDNGRDLGDTRQQMPGMKLVGHNPSTP